MRKNVILIVVKVFQENYAVNVLTFSILVRVRRLILIMVSCGETYVSPEEWVCNAGIVHTRAIVYLIVVKKITTEIRNLI